MFDMQHRFFQPVLIRIGIVALCFGWALLELSRDEGTWAMLFGAIGGYAAYHFLFAWTPPEEDEDDANG